MNQTNQRPSPETMAKSDKKTSYLRDLKQFYGLRKDLSEIKYIVTRLAREIAKKEGRQ